MRLDNPPNIVNADELEVGSLTNEVRKFRGAEPKLSIRQLAETKSREAGPEGRS